ncbi:MAG: hypothetical protein V7749_02565 [Cocleimonas sp.]
MKLSTQIKHNLLAIISLCVALSTLSYNTWRNEQSEANRNVRQAGFEIIKHVGELQKISYMTHYDKNIVKSNPIIGWTEVLILKDLSRLMPTTVQDKADALTTIWGKSWQGLKDEDDLSLADIDIALHELRMEALNNMEQLE